MTDPLTKIGEHAKEAFRTLPGIPLPPRPILTAIGEAEVKRDTARFWMIAFFWIGLLFCTLITAVVAQADEQRQVAGNAGNVFWFGMALIAFAFVLRLEVAVRDLEV